MDCDPQEQDPLFTVRLVCSDGQQLDLVGRRSRLASRIQNLSLYTEWNKESSRSLSLEITLPFSFPAEFYVSWSQCSAYLLGINDIVDIPVRHLPSLHMLLTFFFDAERLSEVMQRFSLCMSQGPSHWRMDRDGFLSDQEYLLLLDLCHQESISLHGFFHRAPSTTLLVGSTEKTTDLPFPCDHDIVRYVQERMVQVAYSRMKRVYYADPLSPVDTRTDALATYLAVQEALSLAYYAAGEHVAYAASALDVFGLPCERLMPCKRPFVYQPHWNDPVLPPRSALSISSVSEFIVRLRTLLGPLLSSALLDSPNSPLAPGGGVCLAGGLVLRVLCADTHEQRPDAPDSPFDVDLWVYGSSPDERLEALQRLCHLLQSAYAAAGRRTFFLPIGRLINLYADDSEPHVQIITRGVRSPLDVVRSFDQDCVQLYFDGATVGSTVVAFDAIRTRTVWVASHDLLAHRWLKSLTKGFSLGHAWTSLAHTMAGDVLKPDSCWTAAQAIECLSTVKGVIERMVGCKTPSASESRSVIVARLLNSHPFARRVCSTAEETLADSLFHLDTHDSCVKKEGEDSMDAYNELTVTESVVPLSSDCVSRMSTDISEKSALHDLALLGPGNHNWRSASFVLPPSLPRSVPLTVTLCHCQGMYGVLLRSMSSAGEPLRQGISHQLMLHLDIHANAEIITLLQTMYRQILGTLIEKATTAAIANGTPKVVDLILENGGTRTVRNYSEVLHPDDATLHPWSPYLRLNVEFPRTGMVHLDTGEPLESDEIEAVCKRRRAYDVSFEVYRLRYIRGSWTIPLRALRIALHPLPTSPPKTPLK